MQIDLSKIASLVSRQEKEERLKQYGKAIWFVGLSGAGKSTIAGLVERLLFDAGYFAQILDGDALRLGINNNLGFSESDRMENIRRVAELSRLCVNNGLISLIAVIAPLQSMRDLARQIVGADDFIEIFVDTPLYLCEHRDVKGLYQKARSGEILNFTGISSPYEIPADPDLILSTLGRTETQAADMAFEFILPSISIQG